MNKDHPTPGSPEALAAGCRCPAIDNHHGKGFRGDGFGFFIVLTCPLHGLPENSEGQ